MYSDWPVLSPNNCALQDDGNKNIEDNDKYGGDVKND
jgi:hypothetical protein